MTFYTDPVGAVYEAIIELRSAMVKISNVNANEYGYVGERARILSRMNEKMYEASKLWDEFLKAKE